MAGAGRETVLRVTAVAVLAAVFLGFSPTAPVRAQGDLSYETTVDQMSRAMGRAYTHAVQKELIARGYAPGTPDGVEGPLTRQAVLAYQRDEGLRQTGRVSRELLDYMKFGISRVVVRDVQRKLAASGYYAGAIDGLAGPMTRAAIRRFEADAGLPVTGVLDPRLSRSLDRALIGARPE